MLSQSDKASNLHLGVLIVAMSAVQSDWCHCFDMGTALNERKENNPTKKGTQIYRKGAQEVGVRITDPLLNNGHPKHLR